MLLTSLKNTRLKSIVIVGLTTICATTPSFAAQTLPASSNQPGKDTRPNIIFVMTDDHAKQAMSAYGGQLLQTPNLDRIANEGIRFDQSFVTNAICGPSRAVALTGKHSHINGVRDNRDTFDGSQETFPKLLQKAGYFTALIGKWHLKSQPTGFDYWKILPGQGDYYNPVFIDKTGEQTHQGYATTLITDFAIDTLEKRDKNQPFALLYFHKAPHRNWMPDTKDLNFFKGKQFPLPDTFFDNYATRGRAAKEADMRIENMFHSFDMKLHLQKGEKDDNSGGNPGWNAIKNWNRVYDAFTEGQRAAWDAVYGPENKAFIKADLKGVELAIWKYQRYIRDYLLTVKSVDDNFGRLYDYLESQSLTENTIIVYTSDQGFYLGEHGWFDKRFMYEESLGIPLAVRFPKAIQKGLVSNELVMNLDIAPTLLDYATVAIPAAMQGQSLRPIIENKLTAEQHWRDSVYYHYYEYPHGWHSVHKHRGVRTDSHKLIHFYQIDEWELYDLKNDPKELNNVYGKSGYQSIENTLKQELKKLRKKYKESS